MPIRYLFLFTLGAVLLTLTGCGASRTTAPDVRYYTLEYESPAVAGQPSKAIIGLSRFGVAPEFNTSRIVYRDLSFGRQEYAYHQWRSAPQALVADYLRRDMQQSGLFLAVNRPGSGLAATHQLEGMIEEWMEVDEEDRWLATAGLTITLLDLSARDLPDQVLFQRTYRESEPTAKKNPGSVVEAMSRAMQKLSERIIADVHETITKSER
jgi:ABC-type uncharacterized transport system auxiliary subunit